jgi:NMD protein affecting ribosome stability and mRNA decay
MFRPSRYKRGDIIEYRGDKIKVTSAVREIFGINLTTQKKVHIKFDRL